LKKGRKTTISEEQLRSMSPHKDTKKKVEYQFPNTVRYFNTKMALGQVTIYQKMKPRKTKNQEMSTNSALVNNPGTMARRGCVGCGD